MENVSSSPPSSTPAGAPVAGARRLQRAGTVRFTNKGQMYWEEDDNEAVKEHQMERLPFMTSLDEIERRYGAGTRMYFDFLKFIIACNVVLFSVAFVNWVVFMASDDSDRTVMCNYPNSNFSYRVGCNCSSANLLCPVFETAKDSITRPLSMWEKLFVGAFTRDQLPSWMGLNILLIVCWFAFGPVYLLLNGRKKILRKLGRGGAEEAEDTHDNIFDLTGVEAHLIPGSDKVSTRARVFRRTISYCIFFSFLVISAGLIYLIQWWGTASYVKANIFLSILVSGLIACINLTWSQICQRLTTFERHRTWSSHRNHHLVKLYVFKICNVTVMYAACQWAFAQEYSCPLQDLGIKFLMLVVLDLFVMNAVEFIIPPSRTWAVRHIKWLHSEGSDESELPEFDVSEEYIELLYRQFVMYMGTLTFPLITFVALVTNIVEFPLDKLRLLKICQRPKRLNNKLVGFVSFFMATTALAAFLSYPNGALWIFLHTGPLSKTCTLWLPKPSSLP